MKMKKKLSWGDDQMKKSVVMSFILILLFSFTGCSDKYLTYNDNMGYDLSDAGYESIEFNVYHSNTKNHTWELLRSFSCLPIENSFVDVRVEGTKNSIIITAENNRVEKTKHTESYYTEDIDTYKFEVIGFSGLIDSFRTFEVKDTDEEQFYHLYPISNDEGGIFFQNPEINKPYDEKEKNLDNILITIKFQR